MITTTDTSVGFTLTGAGQTLAIPYTFLAETDLVVTLNGDTLTLSADYTTTGEGTDGGGSVILDGAVGAADDAVVVVRSTNKSQGVDLVNGDSFDAEVLEGALDRGIAIAQEAEGATDRALRVTAPDTLAAISGDVPVSGVVGFESSVPTFRSDDDLIDVLGPGIQAANDATVTALGVAQLAANARISTNESDIEISKWRNGQTNALGQMVGIGDSLFGTSEADVELPAQVGEALGSPITVQQQDGWIPRHMVWRFLMVNCATVLREDLSLIPPSEFEDRINQDGGVHYGVTTTLINNERTFYVTGQQKWVHATYPGESTSILYEYDDASTATVDGDDVLYCAGGVGRWLKQAGTYARETDYTFLNNATFLVWLGANGMERDDLKSAIEQLARNIGPGNGKIWLMTLANRLHKDHAEVPAWKVWIDECNNMLRDNFANIIEVEDFLLGQQFDQFIPVDAADDDAIAAGVVPLSLKDGTGTGDSHFSQHGNNVLARYIASSMAPAYARRPSISTLGDVQWTRFWQSDGLVALNEVNEVVRLPSYQHTDDAIAMTVPSGSTAPALIPNMLGGKAGLRFRNATDCLENTFGNQNQANTLMCVMRFTDGLTTRADVLDTLTGNRHLLRRNAVASGEWSLYNTTDGATAIATDSDWHVIIAKFDDAASAIWVDGVKTVCTTPIGTTGCAGVGININPTFPFVGDIMNVGFLNSGISDGDATAITTKLLSGYGLG